MLVDQMAETHQRFGIDIDPKAAAFTYINQQATLRGQPMNSGILDKDDALVVDFEMHRGAKGCGHMWDIHAMRNLFQCA